MRTCSEREESQKSTAFKKKDEAPSLRTSTQTIQDKPHLDRMVERIVPPNVSCWQRSAMLKEARCSATGGRTRQRQDSQTEKEDSNDPNDAAVLPMTRRYDICAWSMISVKNGIDERTEAENYDGGVDWIMVQYFI